MSAEFNDATLVLVAALILFPLIASPFIVFQLGSQTLILCMIALSLMDLVAYRLQAISNTVQTKTPSHLPASRAS